MKTTMMTAEEKETLAQRTWYELLMLRPYLSKLTPVEKKRFSVLERIRQELEGAKYIPYTSL